MLNNKPIQPFSTGLLAWFDVNGRKELPWQQPRSAYRVFISEMMLQQTQVNTVIPYFLRFMQRFPDIHSLACAQEDEVFSYWSGLGYYQRARYILNTAAIIVEQYQGVFPQNLPQLLELPGVGPSTAAAIAALAFDLPTAILDGNVIRVLSRYFLIDGVATEYKVKQHLWRLAQACMPQTRCADYTQAIMDLGATCCVRHKPQCQRCPLATDCQAYQNNLTMHYPKPKPARVKPVKAINLLLFHTADNLYLEKQAAQGIWRGLWCLPSINPPVAIETYLAQQYGISGHELLPLLTFKHALTHMQLVITAYAIPLADIASAGSGTWFQQQDLPNLGLAKPVSRIIEHFYQEARHAGIT